MATLFSWDHLASCALVLSLCLELPGHWGVDDWTRVAFDHTTVYRWVQQYGPDLDRRCRPHLRPTHDSWRVDETYIRVKGDWKYLYRAVNSEGNTLDFWLTAKRDAKAAARFFRKALKATHTQSPRVINVDKSPSYPPALRNLQKDKTLSKRTKLRQVKYLNNIVEPDHRFNERHPPQGAEYRNWSRSPTVRLGWQYFYAFRCQQRGIRPQEIKLLTQLGMGFQPFNTDRHTIRGMEAMNMIRKGQIQGVAKGDV
jgi:transposase-like protein